MLSEMIQWTIHKELFTSLLNESAIWINRINDKWLDDINH